MSNASNLTYPDFSRITASLENQNFVTSNDSTSTNSTYSIMDISIGGYPVAFITSLAVSIITLVYLGFKSCCCKRKIAIKHSTSTPTEAKTKTAAQNIVASSSSASLQSSSTKPVVNTNNTPVIATVSASSSGSASSSSSASLQSSSSKPVVNAQIPVISTTSSSSASSVTSSSSSTPPRSNKPFTVPRSASRRLQAEHDSKSLLAKFKERFLAEKKS